jgi:hypothetical protein
MPEWIDDWTRATGQGAEDAWEKYAQGVVNSTQHGRLDVRKNAGRLWDALKQTGGVASTAATQAISKARLPDALMTFYAGRNWPTSDNPNGESSYTTQEQRGQPSYAPKIELPPVPDAPEIHAGLRLIYGARGEHWGESPEQMLQTPEGQQRYQKLQELAETDPSFQEHLKLLSRTISDTPTFWNTALTTYKASRAKDASINPSTIAGAAADFALKNRALGALFEAPAIVQGLRKGILLTKLLGAAADEGTVLPALRMAQLGGVGASTIARGALTTAPKLTSALVGGAVGAGADEDHPVLGALAGAAGGFALGAAGEALAPSAKAALSAVRSTQLGEKALLAGEKLRLAALQPIPNSFEALPGFGQYPGPGVAWTTAASALTGYMDEADPEERALITGAWGGTAALTAKYLGKIPFPLLQKLGVTMATPAIGALVGTMTGRPEVLTGEDEDLLTKTSRDAIFGAGVATLAHWLGPKALDRLGFDLRPGMLRYDQGGDLNEPAVLFSGVQTLEDLRNETNPVTRTRLMQPAIDAIVARGDAAYIEKRDLQHKMIAPIEALLPLKYRDRKALPQTMDTIAAIVERTDENGLPLPGKRPGETARNIAFLRKQDPELVAVARQVTAAQDELWSKRIANGLSDPADKVPGYFAHRPDVAKMRSELQGYPRLTKPRNIEAFHRQVFSQIPLDRVLDDNGAELVGKWRGRPFVEEAGDVATLKDLLLHAPDDVLKQVAHQGFKKKDLGVRSGALFKTREAWNVQASYNDLKSMQALLQASERWRVKPTAALEMLQRGKLPPPKVSSDAEDVFEIDELKRLLDDPEQVPKAILDAASIERKEGPNFPYKTNFVDVLDGEISRYVNKKHFGDLIEGAVDPDTGVRGKPLLQRYFDELGPGFDHHKKVLLKIAKSVMGDTRNTKLEQAIDSLMQNVFKDPDTWPDAARMAKDMVYGAALGPGPTKIGTATRNINSAINLKPLLGTHAEAGILEATRNPAYWRERALKNHVLDHQLMDEVDLLRQGVPGNLGIVSRIAQRYTKYALQLQRWTEERIRTWGFTGGVLKTLQQRTNMDPTFLRPVDAEIVRQRMKLARTEEDWQGIADFVGAKVADLAFWKYGKTGQGWATQGPNTKLFSMFSSWPLNYVSYVKHLAENGRGLDLVNMGVTTMLMDRIAHDKLGLSRFTGYTNMGENDSPDMPIPLPTGPFEMSLSPPMQILAGVGQVLMPGLSGREGVRRIERNAPTLTGPGNLIPRGYGVYDELAQGEVRRARNRGIWGSAPPRDFEE